MLTFKKNILIISFSIFVFFFDFLRDYIDFRLAIFLPLFIILHEIYNYKIKINSNLFYLILLFLLLLILQVQIQEINLDDKIYSFKSIIFLGISIFTVSYYSKFLLKNINLILNYFLIFFLIYIVFFTFLKLDLHIINHQCYIGCFSILDDRFKFFKENSHVGFISSTLIGFMITKIKKINIYFFSLVLFYLFIILNFSLTIFFTIMIIFSYFLVIYFKKFNISQKIIIFILIISSLYNININTGALNKLNTLILFDNWHVKKDLKNSVNTKSKIISKERNLNIKNDTQPKNLSSEVFIVSLNIAKLSIFEKPFGYGINNYHLAFKEHIESISVTNASTNRLNIHDASNNFAKIVTELGVFSLIIFFVFFKFLFSKKISYEYKLIIFPSLFTQTFIRGAGYFNGGFIFFLVLSCYLLYESRNQVNQ